VQYELAGQSWHKLSAVGPETLVYPGLHRQSMNVTASAAEVEWDGHGVNASE